MAVVGSVFASSWPATTCCPALTYTCVSLPLLAKFTLICFAEESVPLPETVDCTTPRETVTVLWIAALVEEPGAPTSTIATITAATTIAART